MQTSFTYNSVLVKDVCTEVWDFSSEKDSTGVDQIGLRCQLVFSGVLHAKTKEAGRPDSSGHTGRLLDDFRGDLFSLLKQLGKDRRRFTLNIGGTTIFTVGPGAIEPGVLSSNRETFLDRMDIANGPTVSIQVVKITAGVSAHIRFTINFTIPNCGDGSNGAGQPSGLVNFRFWISEDIDCRTWLTSRTYSGRIRVAHKNISPQALAGVVTVPPLEDGFQRQIIKWDESSDGLTLDFTIQDRERIASAPWNRFANVGAIDWDGSLTASTGNTFGFTGMVDFRIRLTGPKTTSKADLIKIGFLVAESKARLFEAAAALQRPVTVVLLESLSVTEQFSDNSIEMQAQIRHTGGNIIDGILSIGADQLLGKPMGDLGIGYDPEKHFTPGQTAGVGGLYLSILQTPCNPARMPQSTASQVRRKPQTKSQPATSAGVESYSSIPVANSAMSSSQLDNMYLEYLLSSRLSLNSGRISLATGAAQDSSDPSLQIVNLHRATAMRYINIDATRLNAAPQLPDPSKSFADGNGIGHVLVAAADFEGQAPQISADNRKLIFRAQAHLTYALSRPPRSGENVPIGCVPYRVSSFSDPARVLPAEAFVDPSLLLR